MAEQFSNAVKRRCGIVSTSTGGSIGIKTNLITGISTVDVAVNDLVDNESVSYTHLTLPTTPYV